MANRVLQQKTLKLKKAVRLLPKSYDAERIHVGQQPMREYITDGGKRAVVIPPQILKGTSSVKEAEERARLLFLEAMFPSMFGYQNNEPRQFALARRDVLRKLADCMGDVPLQQHITMIKTKHVKIMLFFDVGLKKHIFVHYDLVSETVKVSVNYGTRERAYDVYRRKSIMYKKAVPFRNDDAPYKDHIP